MSKVGYVFNWIVVHLPLRQLSSLTHLHLAITGVREEETCHRHHHSLLHSFTPRCLHSRSLHANRFTLAWLHARCLHALTCSHLPVFISPYLKVFTYLQQVFPSSHLHGFTVYVTSEYFHTYTFSCLLIFTSESNLVLCLQVYTSLLE